MVKWWSVYHVAAASILYMLKANINPLSNFFFNFHEKFHASSVLLFHIKVFFLPRKNKAKSRRERERETNKKVRIFSKIITIGTSQSWILEALWFFKNWFNFQYNALSFLSRDQNRHWRLTTLLTVALCCNSSYFSTHFDETNICMYVRTSIHFPINYIIIAAYKDSFVSDRTRFYMTQRTDDSTEDALTRLATTLLLLWLEKQLVWARTRKRVYSKSKF